MRLFELDSTKAMATTIVTITDQLKTDLNQGKINPKNWNLDELLKYFHKYNVIIGKDDLFSMIKKDPLKKVIKNIQGDKVVFVGHEEEKVDTGAPEKNEKIVQDMAKKAMKK